MYIVSACLAGIRCRYDGRCNTDEFVQSLVKEGKAVPICPEVLGGLPIPRVPCEIISHEDTRWVMNRDGEDMTGEFVAGARKTLQIARVLGVKTAILKSRRGSANHALRKLPHPPIKAAAVNKAIVVLDPAPERSPVH